MDLLGTGPWRVLKHISYSPGLRDWCLPGGKGTKRAYRHSVSGSLPADVLEGRRQRTVFIQHVVRHHHGEGSRHSKIRHKADEKRGDDPDGNGTLGVFHLLTCKTGNLFIIEAFYYLLDTYSVVLLL